ANFLACSQTLRRKRAGTCDREAKKSRPLRWYGHVTRILVVGGNTLRGNPGRCESGNYELGGRRSGFGAREEAVGAVYRCGRFGRGSRKVWEAMAPRSAERAVRWAFGRLADTLGAIRCGTGARGGSHGTHNEDGVVCAGECANEDRSFGDGGPGNCRVAANVATVAGAVWR